MSIIVDNPDNQSNTPVPVTPETALVQWVMGKVDRWRSARDANFKDRWDEYYRMWRGRWSAKDKNRDSERSRLIAPALSQAIEMTVAEMEEATFGREEWFDVIDPNTPDAGAQQCRDQLLTDFTKAGVPDKIAECYLNGALYGSGIAKIVVEQVAEGKLVPPDPKLPPGSPPIKGEVPRVYIKIEAIPADEFVPDPAGRTVDEMLGCAHEVLKPSHFVAKMQAEGTYIKGVSVGSLAITDGDKTAGRADLEQQITGQDAVLITEYHGLVPAKLLKPAKNELDAAIINDIEGDGPLVEAIVTIGNKSALLRAVKNPFIMNDRSIIAYQHDKVPGRFWGRGVSEKGYNPQKGLDMELRSRADALALIASPMMGADITRLPRGFDLRVRPGKVWGTNGAPKDILQPVIFNGLEPNTFNQSGDMERMVQMGTGAMDTSTPTTAQKQGINTATGATLMVGAFIKRSKRAMANVSRNFLEPLVKKSIWRYIQFQPDKYPKDFDFRVVATNGIMAREFETQQLTQLMGQVPDTMMGPKMLLLQAIVEQSSSSAKKPLADAITKALQPDPAAQQQQQQIQQLQLQTAKLQVQLLQEQVKGQQVTNDKLHADGVLTLAKARTETSKGDIADDQVTVDAARVVLQHKNMQIIGEQNDIAREGNQIKKAGLVIQAKKVDLDHHSAMAAIHTRPTKT